MKSRPLQLLQPRLNELEPRIKMAAPLPRANRTGRDADPRRTLKLNGSAWQKLRGSVLAGEPLCRECTQAGRTVAATDVDHRDGNPGNNDPVNLQPLCHQCHSRKTAAEHGKNVPQGCDTSGLPLDPRHHWNETVSARPAALLRPPVPGITSNRSS